MSRVTPLDSVRLGDQWYSVNDFDRDGQKQCCVLYTDIGRVIQSYDTPVVFQPRKNPNIEYRLWWGWSATTNRHVCNHSRSCVQFCKLPEFVSLDEVPDDVEVPIPKLPEGFEVLSGFLGYRVINGKWVYAPSIIQRTEGWRWSDRQYSLTYLDGKWKAVKNYLTFFSREPRKIYREFDLNQDAFDYLNTLSRLGRC